MVHFYFRLFRRITQLIGKNAVRILFLCSYDKKTLEVVENVIAYLRDIYEPKDYVPKYPLKFKLERRIMPVLARNVKIYEGRSREEIYLIFTEKYRIIWEISIFKDGKIIDIFRCSLKEYKSFIRQLESYFKVVGQYREITAITKVIELCKWADIIVVIKHLELGKGGELIELAIIACSYFFKEDTSLVQKTILLRKSKVRLSWMVKELLKLGYMREKVYKNISSLVEELKNEIDRVTDLKRLKKL
jgi:hypothetical protein